MNRLPASSWQKVVVLAVHPDDESLSAGGLIQHALAQGAEVRVVFITDGDNNPWPQRFVERRWHIDAAARARWGERRRGEAVAALARLGVPEENISFWHYPDQGLTEILLAGGEELIARLALAICQWQPTLLVAPSSGDLHRDHNAFAVLLSFALDRSAFSLDPTFQLLEYVVHTRGEELADNCVEIPLSSEQVALKRRAILSHVTQMALSRRRFLAFAKPTEFFLLPAPLASFDYADPILSADFTGEFLKLGVKNLSPAGSIFLAAETVSGAIRYSIKLSPGTELCIYDGITGDFKAHARLVRGNECDELFLPARFFSLVDKLFIKVSPARAFYDQKGWRLIPLASNIGAVQKAMNTPASTPRICCVIPCYNLAGVCGPIVRAAAGFAEHVIAVDDGSSDETERVLREVADECQGRVQVLSFPQNCGKGIALMEAFRRAVNSMSFDVLVTLDGDGQHRPEDISRLARAVTSGSYSLVIGERLARAKMPLRSRFGNTLTAVVMKLFHPGAPTDTQSGLRAFHRDFVREIVQTIEGGRYETELEILLLALQQGHRIGSVTIPTVYLEGNRLSHFRPIIDSWRIYRTLFRWQFNPVRHPEPKTPLVASR